MNFSHLYDVSVTLSPDLAVWPGDPEIEFQQTALISQGAESNVTRLLFGAHSATHMDAPRHFIDGATGIDQMPLDALVGTAWVVDFTALDRHIGAADLDGAGLPANPERILLKTRNSAMWASDPGHFHEDYVALAPDGAQWLLDHGVRLVGIDYLSIEEFKPDRYHTHYSLLGERVVVVEGLNLGAVEAGEYTVFALPIKVKDGDGAPARVLLGR